MIMNQKTTSASTPKRILAWTFGGLLVVGLIAGLTVLRSTLKELFSPSGCDPSLLLQGKQYRLRSVEPKPDGTLAIPPNRADTAFWVEGTAVNRVFALSPNEANAQMVASLRGESEAVVTQADCNTASFRLSGPASEAPSLSAVLDQSRSAITIYLPPGNGSTGLIVRGELAEETIQSFDTPNPGEPQAEISLLEVRPGTDGTSLVLHLSILNTGTNPLPLESNAITLTAEDGSLASLSASDPALPQTIEPGSNLELFLTFPRPSSPSATLELFGVALLVEEY